MAVDIDIIYEGDLHCSAIHRPSGHQLTTDAPTDNGGKGETFSPTDLVATALGTCIITVVSLVARKNNLELKNTKIHVVKEMTDVPTRRIGLLKIEIEFPKGISIPKAERIKLEKAAEACPVKRSLHPDVKVSLTFKYPD